MTVQEKAIQAIKNQLSAQTSGAVAQNAQNQGSVDYQYNAENDPVYQTANQKVKDLEGQTPTFANTYGDQLKDYYDQVVNYKPFTYDLNGDALWQQYKDQYTNQGKLAMMDTMGQAAALTGGYGSSYAQSAGQQAYQGYLQQLNDRIPELYQLAMDKYNNDYALLKDQYSTTAQMNAEEYGRYQDEVAQHNTEIDRARSDENTAYERGSNAWLTGEQLRRDDENTAYAKQQDNYDRLASLISSTGYTPTQAELEAAGMSAEQAQAYLKGYKDSTKKTKSSSSSNNSGEKKGYHGVKVAGGGSLSSENIRMIQWSLGVEVTGVWDQATVDASGYKNSNDCYEDWSKGKVVNAKEWSRYYMPQMQEANKISAQIKNMKSDAEKENVIREAYEAGRIDKTMAQELLLQHGLA